ncbi:hypothetical protein GC197_11140 [bacterium]|nr:hypothetical protein [bacterium]
MSVARCPRCSEEFSVGEIFGALPPEVEIVSGPGSEVMVGFSTESDGHEYALAGGDVEASPKTDFQFRESGPMASSTPMAKVDSSRPSRKPKRREMNMTWEMIKIVLGGLAAFPAFILIAMWGFHQDVFKLIPQMPAWSYYVVPADMRSDEMKAYAGDLSDTQTPEPEANPTSHVRTETIKIDKQDDATNTPEEPQPGESKPNDDKKPPAKPKESKKSNTTGEDSAGPLPDDESDK